VEMAASFAIVAALAIALDEGPLQYALKYLHFSALSKETLIRETEAYIRGVAGGDQMACLYVVACDGEDARLELVSDIAGPIGPLSTMQLCRLTLNGPQA
jgi:hypothetical protein